MAETFTVKVQLTAREYDVLVAFLLERPAPAVSDDELRRVRLWVAFQCWGQTFRGPVPHEGVSSHG